MFILVTRIKSFKPRKQTIIRSAFGHVAKPVTLDTRDTKRLSFVCHKPFYYVKISVKWITLTRSAYLSPRNSSKMIPWASIYLRNYLPSLPPLAVITWICTHFPCITFLYNSIICTSYHCNVISHFQLEACQALPTPLPTDDAVYVQTSSFGKQTTFSA